MCSAILTIQFWKQVTLFTSKSFSFEGVVAQSYHQYRDYLVMDSIYYEDLVSNPRQVLSSLFSALNISLDNLDTAVSQLNWDSQQETWLSKEKMKDVQSPPMNDMKREGLRRAAQYFNLSPDFFFKYQDQL